MSTKERIPVDAGMDYFDRNLPDWMGNSHDRDICEYWIDELQTARAKDAKLIQQLVDALSTNTVRNGSAEWEAWVEHKKELAMNSAASAGFTPTKK